MRITETDRQNALNYFLHKYTNSDSEANDLLDELVANGVVETSDRPVTWGTIDKFARRTGSNDGPTVVWVLAELADRQNFSAYRTGLMALEAISQAKNQPPLETGILTNAVLGSLKKIELGMAVQEGIPDADGLNLSQRTQAARQKENPAATRIPEGALVFWAATTARFYQELLDNPAVLSPLYLKVASLPDENPYRLPGLDLIIELKNPDYSQPHPIQAQIDNFVNKSLSPTMEHVVEFVSKPVARDIAHGLTKQNTV